jgi:hypothetical protein
MYGAITGKQWGVRNHRRQTLGCEVGKVGVCKGGCESSDPRIIGKMRVVCVWVAKLIRTLVHIRACRIASAAELYIHIISSRGHTVSAKLGTTVYIGVARGDRGTPYPGEL